jgi:hypothetical protein
MTAAPAFKTTLAPVAKKDEDYGIGLSVLGATFRNVAEKLGGEVSLVGGDVEARPVLQITFNDARGAKAFAEHIVGAKEASASLPALSLKTTIVLP